MNGNTLHSTIDSVFDNISSR